MRWLEQERWAPWIVGVAAFLVYANSLFNGFVFDDLITVRDNPIVREPRFLLYAFTTDYWRGTSSDLLYRPLTVFSYGIDNLVHGMRPLGFHLVNVLLHALVSLVVLRLTRQLIENKAVAFLTALLFALHPIHTEAVASIVGRAELLMSLFSLLAIQYFIEARSLPGPQARHKFTACLLCFLFACLSKENGIMVPALILLAEASRCLSLRNWDPWRGDPLRRAAYCYATLAATGVVYLLVRFMVLGNLTIAHAAENRMTFRGLLLGFPWHMQFANALQYFAKYLGLLFFPFRLSSDYSFDQLPAHASIWHWDIGIGALALAALVIVAAVSVKRAPPVFFGIAFFLVAFFPTSNFLIPIMTILAERTMYLPSFGFLLAAAWVAVAALGERGGVMNVGAATMRRRLASTACVWLALLLTFFSVRTLLRNREWHDEISLFASAVRICPRCANAWNCYADALAEAGRFEQAVVAYNRSLEIIPDHGVFWFRKANALMKWGHTNEAVEAYKKALEFEPQLSDAADTLSRICIDRGNLDEALQWSLKAVAVQPTKAVFHYNLGYVFQRLRKPREAIRQYQEAATLNPDEPSYAFNLGLVQRDLGEVDNAFTNFQRAAELNPRNEKYWMTLADTALKKGALQPAALALDEFVKVSTNASLISKAKEILGQIRNPKSEAKPNEENRKHG